MKNETKYLIEEMKQRQYLNELYESRIINLDSYFKYSGKEEMRIKKYKYGVSDYSRIVSTETIDSLERRKDSKKKEKILQIYNDMSEYKLKKDRVVW